MVVFLIAISFWRTQVWNSDEWLWREAVEHAPDKLRPRIHLARALRPDEAIRVLSDARPLAPDDPTLATELGQTWMRAGDPASALREFGKALALNPRDPNNYNNRGVALAALGQDEAARLDFEHALRIDPGLATARSNLRKMEAR